MRLESGTGIRFAWGLCVVLAGCGGTSEPEDRTDGPEADPPTQVISPDTEEPDGGSSPNPDLPLPAHCFNDVADGNETGLNCGGDCPGCTELGAGCFEQDDCGSIYICGPDGLCDLPECEDGLLGPTETDIDCGGGVCASRCDEDESCLTDNGTGVLVPSNTNCIDESGRMTVCNADSGICDPPTCTDGLPNGEESDIDCGFLACRTACDLGQACAMDLDCQEDFFHLVDVGATGPFTEASEFKSVAYKLTDLDSVLATECADRQAKQVNAGYTCDAEIWVPYVVFDHSCDGACARTGDTVPRQHVCEVPPSNAQCPVEWDDTGPCEYLSDCATEKRRPRSRRLYTCVPAVDDQSDPISDADGSPAGTCEWDGSSYQGSASTSCPNTNRDTTYRPLITTTPSYASATITELDLRRVLADIEYEWGTQIGTYSEHSSFNGARNSPDLTRSYIFDVCGQTGQNGFSDFRYPEYDVYFADDEFALFFEVRKTDEGILRTGYLQDYLPGIDADRSDYENYYSCCAYAEFDYSMQRCCFTDEIWPPASERDYDASDVYHFCEYFDPDPPTDDYTDECWVEP